jgi:hypothetical protein
MSASIALKTFVHEPLHLPDGHEHSVGLVGRAAVHHQHSILPDRDGDVAAGAEQDVHVAAHVQRFDAARCGRLLRVNDCGDGRRAKHGGQKAAETFMS